MPLTVHHASRLTSLATALGDVLAAPPDDPFTGDVVAVPTAGVRDFVRTALARRFDVVANVDIPFPGALIARALGLGGELDDPWHVDRLVWPVLTAIEAGAAEVPGWAEARRADRSRRFSTARRIADLFDRYATARPELLAGWATGATDDGTGGALPESFVWQRQLWLAVRELVGTPSLAERFPALIEQLRGGTIEPELPERVAWFGLTNVPVTRLRVLSALAERRDVHVFAVRPSAVRWQHTDAIDPHRLTPRTGRDDRPEQQRSPLLDSWAAPSTELGALLRGLTGDDGVEMHAVDEPPRPTTLLATLQRSIGDDVAPHADDGAAADGSLQVHACHGATRQLEVLRDALGHLFVADPTLAPSDVLVVCPDVARFEPFAASVFDRGTLPIPLAVSDLSLGADNPVAVALDEILAAVADRCTATDLLTVAAADPVRLRLGISADDLDLLARWVDDLDVRWGADVAHRIDVLGDDPDGRWEDGTWSSMVHSLLVGAAVPAPTARRVPIAAGVRGVFPFDDLDASAMRTAGRIAELVARLQHVRRAFGDQPRTVAEWCAELRRVLDLLCSAPADESWQMSRVLTAIDDVERSAAAAGDDSGSATLLAADARAIAAGLDRGRRGRLRLRTGAVTMTGLQPLRNVPARVVCLLGFDEESLRPPVADGDDLLGLRPCVGESDRRADRRQAVLDAVLAAEQHLLVVCDGRDLSTNRRVRFPVQLTELLDAVAQLGVDVEGTSPSSPTVRRDHPLRSFDPDNFDGRAPFSFDDTMFAACAARDAGSAIPFGELLDRWRIDADLPATVTIDELVEACTRPARVLVRDALDARVPGEARGVEVNLPLDISPLEGASIGRRLLDHWRRTGDFAAARAAWEIEETAAVGTPPGRLAAPALNEIATEVDGIGVALAKKLGSSGWPVSADDVIAADDSLPVDIVLAADGTEVRLIDAIGDVAVANDGWRMISDIEYARPKPRYEVAAAICLAAAIVASGDARWAVALARRGEGRTGRPKPLVVGPLRDVVAEPSVAAAEVRAAAERLLETAVAKWARARRGPLAIFETASPYWADKRAFDDESLYGTDYTTGDLDQPETSLVWSGATTKDLLDANFATHAVDVWTAVCALGFGDG